MKTNIIKVAVGLFACLISICMPYDAAFALTRADYSKQGIKYYDSAATAVACPAIGGGAGPLGNSNLIGANFKEQIWNFLTGHDKNIPAGSALTDEQAAAVMGNMDQETGGTYDPATQEKSPKTPPGGYGIAQWTGTRRTALFKAGGASVNDLKFQLGFLYNESQDRKVSKTVANQGYGTAGANEWQTLKQQQTLEKAVVFWHNNFEVSADTPSEVLSGRLGPAKALLAELGGKTPDGTSTGSSGGVCSSDSGGLIGYVMKYAWPKHYQAPHLEATDDYTAAITKAQADGRYVGGLAHPGIDCGGFVTTLMYDSGFEPRYNYNAKGGNTDSQEAWARANWQPLGSNADAGTLQPGDVAFSPGHTFVWVGDVPGFESKIASASVSLKDDQSWRAPMAGVENPTASNVTWYRKKA